MLVLASTVAIRDGDEYEYGLDYPRAASSPGFPLALRQLTLDRSQSENETNVPPSLMP